MALWKYEFTSLKGKILSSGKHKGGFIGAVSKVRRAIKRKKRPWDFCTLYFWIDFRWVQESRWIHCEDGSIIEHL